MDKFSLKTPEEVKIMAEGGQILRKVRNEVAAMVKPGVTSMDLEKAADRLITEAGAKASFKLVPGYHHATCININEVVVHGIPGKQVIYAGDKVSIDVGAFYKGFHTDTAVTVVASGQETVDKELTRFLDIGRFSLSEAIKQAKPGKRIADISKAMQKVVEGAGYSAVRALTGHGIGRNLHEEPSIPCFVVGNYQHSPLLQAGMVIAIEVMYNAGTFEVIYKNNDGWTISTADGKISGLFEHTVAVTRSGPVILT